MAPAFFDLEGLAAELCISKNSLQRFWRELPYIRIPSSEGDDGRGARFIVEDVVEYLVLNHSKNYVGHRRPEEDERGASKQRKRRKSRGSGKWDADDPHGLKSYD